MAARWGVRRKKRSGWKHPLDLNRNRRRCEKRRRSASAATRYALDTVREAEVRLELREARRELRTIDRGGPERRPACGLAPGGAW